MYCGTRTESMVPCASCGRSLLASAPKCNYCGRAKSTSLKPPPAEDVARARAETLQSAEIARAGRQFAAALPLYEQVVALDPANVRAWLGLAKTLTHLHRIPDAVAALDRALALQPDHTEASALRKTLVPSKLPSSTVFRAVTTNTAIAAADARATELAASGDPAAALTVIDTLLRSLPEPAVHSSLVGLHFLRGLCLRALGRVDDALDAQEQALRCEPRHVRSWIEKGELLAGLERSDEAVSALENAVAYDAEDALAWTALADVLRRVDRREDALAAYERALAVDPSLARARAGRADLTR